MTLRVRLPRVLAGDRRGATIVEDYYRDHPEGLEKRIKEEMEKNNTL